MGKNIARIKIQENCVISMAVNIKLKEYFVKKSVANNLNDYLKVNLKPTIWEKLANTDTKWIVKHAKRNLENENSKRKQI